MRKELEDNGDGGGGVFNWVSMESVGISERGRNSARGGRNAKTPPTAKDVEVFLL